MDIMEKHFKKIELNEILTYFLKTMSKEELLKLIEENIDIINLFK